MASSKFKIESGVQLLTRLTKKSDIENFYPNIFLTGPKHGDIVEVFSNIDDISFILSDIICEALIPQNCLGMGILVFRTDGRLDFEYILNNLRLKLMKRYQQNCSTELVETMLTDILSNLYILQIYDATQLYTTIHSLDNILMEQRNISLIIFDTLTAFYWSEQGFKLTKMDVFIKNLLRIILNVTKDHKVVCIYTRPEYFSSTKDANNPEKCELFMEGLNYKVQLKDRNENGDYQVNIRTLDSYFEKYFNIVNKEICWQ